MINAAPDLSVRKNKNMNIYAFVKMLFIITISFLPSCAFIGQPMTSDPWELIEIARWRMEDLDRPVGARNVLLQALPEAEKKGDKEAVQLIYNELGRTYIRDNHTQDTEKAKHYYLKSLAINKTEGWRFYMAQNHYNLANMHSINGNNDKACSHLNYVSSLLNDIESNPAKPPDGTSEEYLKTMKDATIRFSGDLDCPITF